jgi:hypothetical protein
VAAHQLQHLAAGDGVGGLGEHLHDAHVVDLDHHLEGARVEEVADQHRRRVAEGGVGGAAAAAQPRLVDHVVVQEGRGVDEFDYRRQLKVDLASWLVAGGAAGEQQQRRAQALAAGGDDVLRHLAHQRHVGVQAPADQCVDPGEVLLHRPEHGQRIHESLIIPSLSCCNGIL